MAEELNQQIGDANPGLRKYIIQAWEKETGGKGVEAFLKAMSKREVTPEMLMNAIRAQARDVAPRVEEFASTAESAKNRLDNAKFAEEMQRTLDSDGMVPSIKRFTAAQQELHTATIPLRDAMYSLGAGALSATASLVSWSAKALENSPAMAKQASYEQRSEALMAPSMGRGLLSVPNITRLQEKPRQPITPMLYQKPEWRMQADQYANPESILEQLSSTTNNVSVQSSVSFQQGAFQIQTQATDAQTLAAELQPLIQEQFDVSLQRTLSEVDASFGSK